MSGAAPVILPLRVIDQPGGPVIRCLCGAEAAVARLMVPNRTMLGLRGSGPRMNQLRPDLSPHAVLSMVLHAKRCNRAAEVLSRVTADILTATPAGS